MSPIIRTKTTAGTTIYTVAICPQVHISLNSEIGHSLMRSSLGVGSGCDERIQLRRSRDLPTQDAVEQRVSGFQTAPALGEMEHEPATCAAQDGSAGKDLGANRCRVAITRQIGSALELNQ